MDMSASFIKMCLAPPFTAKGWGVDEAGGMARSRGTGLKREGPWEGTRKGLAAALQRQFAPTERAVRIRRRRPRGRIVGEWGCRETPPMCVSMLLTIKELAEQLRIKPLDALCLGVTEQDPVRPYAWTHPIPSRRHRRMADWVCTAPTRGGDIDAVIAAAKRAIYNPRHGETGPALGRVVALPLQLDRFHDGFCQVQFSPRASGNFF